MKRVLESHIEAKVIRYCKSKGYYCRKLGTNTYSGMPDRLICHAGKALFLELKAPNKEPTPLQSREIRLLNDVGMAATWADSYESCVRAIEAAFWSDVI